MKHSDPKPIYLKDYKQPNYLPEKIDLTFEIDLPTTRVTATTVYKKNGHGHFSNTMELNGSFFQLESIHINEVELATDQLKIKDEVLHLENLPDEFTLEVVSILQPEKNTALEGLYKSGEILCTQNEAEGFRRITYFQDRPDVMTSYTTSIIADKDRFPFLLSNGNLVEEKELADNKKLCKWHDPHKKPCYLYALVAGDLGLIEDHFTTQSGRNVKLQLFVDKGDEDRAHHAMESLKKSMKWDEETYGLEYDLDIYMIVSVHSFNAGAMENKGLNIFNSKYVLANPNTATDDEYEAIQGVIGHEYFHNWSGNRVTCRDWFQLSLKEGLTVYRDQEFTSDMTSRPVKRINDVNMLRTNQFAEDSGPMAHPVRPASYISVNNFYTLTVYEKGSEVVRMIHTIIGDENFKKGLTEYFNRFDGQAVTTDDFVLVMEEVSGVDLKQFKNWYSQAGTPEVNVSWHFDEASQSCALTMKQSSKPSPNQAKKEHYHIPVKTAFFDETGSQLEFEVSGSKYKEKVFHLNQEEQTFKINGLKKGATPSILRNFSAPVNLNTCHSEEELCFLFAKDTDQFNRWDSGQKLSLKYILNNIKNLNSSKDQEVPDFYLNSFQSILDDKTIDPSFKSQLLIIPDDTYINQFVDEIDPFVIFEAREYLRKKIAGQYKDQLLELYNQLLKETPNTIDPQAISNRKLKNSILGLLSSLEDSSIHGIANDQYKNAKNMTDRLSALAYLNNVSGELRENAMADFYQQFSNDTLTMDKWFTLHATSELPGGLERIKNVMNDPTFDIKTPNKVYSLLYRFGRLNTKNFHDPNGASYEFYKDQILKIDQLNPQVASRLTGVFNLWKRYEPKRRDLIKTQLENIVKQDGLSNNVFEIASKALS